MPPHDPDDFGLTQDYRAPTHGDVAEDEARVVVISGPMNGATFALAGTQVTVGRHPDTGIHLPLTGVSRLHCSFLVNPNGTVSLRDEGAKNGTDVNGRRLEERQALQLAHGDTIRICQSVLFFLNPRSSAAAATADPVSVDFGAARSEADEFLGDLSDLVELRRRRKKG